MQSNELVNIEMGEPILEPSTFPGTILIPVPKREIPLLRHIDTMDGYLQAFGPILGKKAIDSLTPLHVKGRDPLPNFIDVPRGRTPFDCQGHTIAAGVKMLDAMGSGFLCGEMGTGKTLIGMLTFHMHACRLRSQGGMNGKYRGIILAPDHLLGKWEREIKQTIPSARVTRFGPARSERDAKGRRVRKKNAEVDATATRQTLGDILELMSVGEEEVKVIDGDRAESAPKEYAVSLSETEFETRVRAPRPTSGKAVQRKKKWKKPEGPEWYVLGRNQAKWLSDWAGVADTRAGFDSGFTSPLISKTVVVKSERVTDEHGNYIYNKNGKPVLTKELGKIFLCPKCGTPLKNDKGIYLTEAELKKVGGKSVQRKCKALVASSQRDPDNAKIRPNDFMFPGPHDWKDGVHRIPGRYMEKKAGDDFSHNGVKWVVRECGEPLYQYTAAPYRWAPARIIQKQLRGMFNYLAIDEVHEQKSDESAQSMACGKILASCRHVLGLTGTIIGGYADHLYPLMMRITPKTLRAEGFEWGKDLKFSEQYGKIEQVITTSECGGGAYVDGKAGSMRRAKSGKPSEKKYVRPGIMPTMFGRHMIANSMFITLEEMSDNLPQLFEYVGGGMPEFVEPAGTPEEIQFAREIHEGAAAGWHEVACDMEYGQKKEYARVAERLDEANVELLQRGSMKLLGAYLWTLLDYPDRPFGWGHDPELMKSIMSLENQAPDLLGQTFLKNFDCRFDASKESLTLSRTENGVTEEDVIPLTKKGGVYCLDVSFNGFKPRQVIYDTGASDVALSMLTADEVGLKKKKGDGIASYRIADGSVVEARTTSIASVRVGKFTVRDVPASVSPPCKMPHTVGYWVEPGIRLADNWHGVVTPADQPEDTIYPKERTLIDICKQQKKEGIQTWVYVNMTGKRNIQPRLKKLLEAEGLSVEILTSTKVKPIEREEWILENGRKFDVILSHPQLVSTGLDLFSKADGGHNYSTIVFYETGYNLFTMRQAARRAWRIGQYNNCRVYYLYYKGTMQHKAMQLMSKKMAAAQALEGEFTADGLAAMAGEDNAQMSLAKNLAGAIDTTDIQRSWTKVNSGGAVSKKRDSLSDLGKGLPPSPLDDFPIELQMVGESMIEGRRNGRRRGPTKMAEPPRQGIDPTLLDQFHLLFPDDLGDTSGDQPEEPKEPKVKPVLRIAEPIDEEDEESDMPALTPEAMARMFANMMANHVDLSEFLD